MSDRIYENHVSIRKDKLCPFKLRFVERSFGCVSNWHKNIELILIAGGSGTVRYGRSDLPVEKGDFIIVNTDTLHRLYSADGMDYYFFIIDESFCAENGISTENRIFEEVFRSEQTGALFKNLIDEMAAYTSDTPSYLKASRVRLAALALLIDLCENHSAPRAAAEKNVKNTEAYIRKTMEYIGFHYRETLTLEGLADVCGITKCYLAREFKAYTGQTVMAYLNMIRCRNAEICLAEGRSVTDAACECGFESVSYFSRTYKKLMGFPPSRFAAAKETT